MAKNAKRKNNKKGKQGGFTLIELLAVITIMGILMMVAIPQISRTIENSRRDTFMNTASAYVSAVKTMWDSDSFNCRKDNQTDITAGAGILPSALGAGTYYVLIDSQYTADTNKGTANNLTARAFPALLESGGKSSWGNAQVRGWVKVVVSGAVGASNRTVSYSIYLVDSAGHGIGTPTAEVAQANLKRASVKPSGGSYIATNQFDGTNAATASSIPSETIIKNMCQAG